MPSWALILKQKMTFNGHRHHRVWVSALTFIFMTSILSSNVVVAQPTSETDLLQDKAKKEYAVGDNTAAEMTLRLTLLSAQSGENLFDELRVRRLLASQEQMSLENRSYSYAALGNYREAESLLREANSISEISSEPDNNDIARNLMRIGISQLLGGKLARAEESLVASLSIYERKERGLWTSSPDFLDEMVFNPELEVLRWLAKLRVQQGRPAEALLLTERGRSRTLASLFRQAKNKWSVYVNPFPAVSEATAISLEEVQKVATSRQVTIVEYGIVYTDHPERLWMFDDTASQPVSDLLIWVVQPNGKIAHKHVVMAPPVRFADLIGGDRPSFLRGLSLGALRGAQPHGQSNGLTRLAEILIDPIEDLLPKEPDSHIVFVPQDALFRVSFAALQTRDGKYLIEKYAISTAPSIKVMRLTNEMQAQLMNGVGQALIVGNPEMPMVAGERLPDLPAAGHEAETIAALLRTSALVGAAATKPAVVARAPSARLIHLATHGLLDNGASDLSAIALAPTKHSDGLLRAREIARLRLQAELVVISACDTARGEITPDGVRGLSRALLRAGASSLVLSLWSVPDAPTAFLMRRFYQHLTDKGDKAQALRAAMLETMKEHPAPVDWAAFVLIGSSAISRSLMAGLKTGMPQARDYPSILQGADEAFPVPAGVTNYSEHYSARNPGSVVSGYWTTMSQEALLEFYRKFYGDRGFRETDERDSYPQQDFKERRVVVFTPMTTATKIIVTITTSTKYGYRSTHVSIKSKVRA